MVNPDGNEDSGSTEPGGLQFDRAEYGAESTGGITCSFCRQEVTTEYYDVNGTPVCADCEPEVRDVLVGGAGAAGRFARAMAAGLVGALIGGGIYGGVAIMSGSAFGLIALLVGWIVGRAVQWGAQRRGGLGYQLMAAVLTYLAVTQWEVVHATFEYDLSVAEVIELIGAALWLPVSGDWDGSQLIGLLIIGFAIFEAWTLNRATPIRISGPLAVGARSRGMGA